MRTLTVMILLLGAALVATVQADERAPVAPEQNATGSCGVKLVLKNPDLQARSDGFIHVSGWFFIQFQAVGPGAERVKSFTFSFGKAFPDGVPRCDLVSNQHATGAYLLNYRGDYTPEDGFFVPINTTLVRDDEYGAAVHAYDQPNAQGNEIGRFYAKAKVENGCAQMQCSDKTIADIIKNDKVIPWPRILPGDGVQASNVEGVTIEFAESVRDAQLFVNGNQTNLTAWTGREMDDDIRPGNDNMPCGNEPGAICKKRVWGPAYLGAAKIQQNDVVRVVAFDLNNNRVEKILHLLDPTQGGIVTGDQVELEITVENSTRRAGPQQDAEFVFKFLSLSTSEAHVNLLFGGYPEDKINAKWHPGHIVVKPGERAQAGLIVSGKPGVTSGSFEIKAQAQWRSGGQDVTREIPVTFVVGSGENAPTTSAGTANETGGALHTDADTPGPGIVVGFAAMGLVAILVRRRR